MMFLLRGIHLSFWLFVVWLALRVWEPNFEVSPLPDWTLTVFIFLVLLLAAFLIGRRLFKRHLITNAFIAKGTAYLLVGGILWEVGLTVYLSSWRAIPAMFVWRFFVGLGVQIVGIFLGAEYLKSKEDRQMPEGVV